jgi:hypothetical protein
LHRRIWRRWPRKKSFKEVGWLEIVKTSYQLAVGAWGIQPEDFWQMSYEEWWWLFETKRTRDKQTDYAGRLTEDDCADLYSLLH